MTQQEIEFKATTDVAEETNKLNKILGKKLAMNLLNPIERSPIKDTKIPIKFAGENHELNVEASSYEDNIIQMKATTHNGAMYFHLKNKKGSLDLHGERKELREYKAITL